MLLKTLLSELTPHPRHPSSSLGYAQQGGSGFAQTLPPPAGLSNGAGYAPDSLASGSGFASTAILEEAVRAIHEQPGGPAPQQVYDVFVSGSAAQAIRSHLAAAHAPDTTSGAGQQQRMITLFDPARVWAGAVVRTLSDATGQPLDRLHLRDQTTFKSLATIERTCLPRNSDELLRIYHADVPGRHADTVAIPLALMERSDLSAVVVDGQMHPSSVDDMLRMLQTTSASSEWRCQHLLFLLPNGAHWINHKIENVTWPSHVQVQTISESISSPSGVWNKLLGHWQHVCLTAPAAQALSASPSPVQVQPAVAAHIDEPADAPTSHAAPRPELSPVFLHRAQSLMEDLMQVDGLIYVMIADVHLGQVRCSSGSGPDIDRAAQAGCNILKSHRDSLRALGHWKPNEPVEEVLVTAGTRYHLLRVLPAHPDFFMLAVLDKLRSNLAITRFRVMEAIQALG
jgi:hypothetical protein